MALRSTARDAPNPAQPRANGAWWWVGSLYLRAAIFFPWSNFSGQDDAFLSAWTCADKYRHGVLQFCLPLGWTISPVSGLCFSSLAIRKGGLEEKQFITCQLEISVDKGEVDPEVFWRPIDGRAAVRVQRRIAPGLGNAKVGNLQPDGREHGDEDVLLVSQLGVYISRRGGDSDHGAGSFAGAGRQVLRGSVRWNLSCWPVFDILQCSAEMAVLDVLHRCTDRASIEILKPYKEQDEQIRVL